MKQITQICLILLVSVVAFAGCDAAKEKMDQAKDSAKDMADVDFGDFNMKGMKDKFNGVTDGFKDVTADNVGGLTTKISDLSGSIDGMGIGNLKGTAKTAVGTLIAKFVETIKSAMAGISDDGILSKLKPVVDPLMEKLKGFM